MNLEVFTLILTILATITSLTVEAFKITVGDKLKYSSNIVTLITSVLVAGVTMVVYYQLQGVPFTVNNTLYILIMMFANFLGSTVGYDKVTQTIAQIKTKK